MKKQRGCSFIKQLLKQVDTLNKEVTMGKLSTREKDSQTGLITNRNENWTPCYVQAQASYGLVYVLFSDLPTGVRLWLLVKHENWSEETRGPTAMQIGLLWDSIDFTHARECNARPGGPRDYKRALAPALSLFTLFQHPQPQPLTRIRFRMVRPALPIAQFPDSVPSHPEQHSFLTLPGTRSTSCCSNPKTWFMYRPTSTAGEYTTISAKRSDKCTSICS